MTNPLFSFVVDENETLLHCPVCNSYSDVHPTGYEMFTREYEDGPVAHVSQLSKEQPSIIPNTNVVTLPNAVPGRRDSYHLMFVCSDCGAKFELSFIQHKGPTYVRTTVLD